MEKLIIAASLMLLASCAGRAPNPVAVTQVQDTTMTCDFIHAEIAANTTKVSQLGSEQGSKTAQNVAAGVAGLLIWPLWFAMDFQGAATKEIAALEARNSYSAGRALQTCTAVAQNDKIAPATAPTVTAVGGTSVRAVHEPRVIAQPSRMPSPVEVPATVLPGDPCAKYAKSPTESRCRLYVAPDGWQYIPIAGRSADLDSQLRCAPLKTDLTHYEQCIATSGPTRVREPTVIPLR